MDLAELGRAAFDSVRSHKLRSFLTLLGIIIGVTTIVGVASVITGLEAYVQEKLIQLSPDVFVITKFGIIQSREEFFQAVKRPDFDYHDVEVLSGTLALADAVAADVTTAAPVRYRDRRLADMRIHGTTANFAGVVNLEIESGRYFTEADETAGSPVAVIGWDIKEELYPAVDPIGRDILIGNAAFRIVGVVAQQGRMLGLSQDNQAWVPMHAFRKTWGRRNSIDLVLRARGGVAGLDASIDEARAVVRALRHTGFREQDPFGLVTAEALQGLWRQISTAAFVLTLLIAGVSLGVGGVVIANIMLVGVVERTREIGVRLAVGARPRDIRRQFLLEAAILSVSGGIAGVVLGSAAAFAVQGILHFPARVTPIVLSAGLGLSAAVGLVAGYWPARRAAALVVVDALRDEA